MTIEDKRTERERKQAEEAHRRTNPLGILCLECGALCHLSEDGKRWLCRDERHNGKKVTRNKDK